jgi:hypothetical protein
MMTLMKKRMRISEPLYLPKAKSMSCCSNVTLDEQENVLIFIAQLVCWITSHQNMELICDLSLLHLS